MMYRLRTISLFVAMLWLPVLSASAEDTDLAAELSQASAALDQAFVDHDRAAIEALTTDDHVAMTPFYGRPFTIPQQFAVLDSLIITGVDRSAPTTVALGPDAAMVTYENSYQGSYDGAPLSERVYVTEIWVREGGAWLQRQFQETPLSAD